MSILELEQRSNLLMILKNTRNDGSMDSARNKPGAGAAKKEFWGGVFQNVIATLICSVICVAVAMFISIKGLEGSIDNINSEITGMKNSISDLDDKVEKLDAKVDGIDKRLVAVEEKVDGIDKRLTGVEDRVSDLESYHMEQRTIYVQASSPIGQQLDDPFAGVDQNDVIGNDRKTGKKVKAKDLVGKKFLTYYYEGNQLIFFFGQYDENYHWDGDCVINVYEGKELVFAEEAVYESRELKSYKQAFSEKEKGLWYVSDREHGSESNTGVTRSYHYKEYPQRKFTEESVKVKNMVSIDKFLETLEPVQEGYYSGDTSNGRYHDESGKAILVKLNDDETVRFIYQGLVIKGNPTDTTGSAWCIVWTDKGYFKETGCFENGRLDRNKKYAKNGYLSKKELKELMNDLGVSDDFKWK